MNPLIEQFKRDMEEFKKKTTAFKSWELVPNTPRKIMMSDRNAQEMFNGIYIYHTQSLLNLINKMIEECEGKKKNTDNHPIHASSPITEAGRESHERALIKVEAERDAHNLCLSSTIFQLEELKKYLEELKK